MKNKARKEGLNKKRFFTLSMKRYVITLFQIFITFVLIIWGANIYRSISNRYFGGYSYLGVFIIIIGLILILFPKILRRVFRL